MKFSSSKEIRSLLVEQVIDDLGTKAQDTRDILVIRVDKDNNMLFRTTMTIKDSLHVLELSKFDLLYEEKLKFKMKDLH